MCRVDSRDQNSTPGDPPGLTGMASTSARLFTDRTPCLAGTKNPVGIGLAADIPDCLHAQKADCKIKSPKARKSGAEWNDPPRSHACLSDRDDHHASAAGNLKEVRESS